MRRLLAAAAVLGLLMVPTTTTTARTFGLPCDAMSLEGTMCGIQYEDDLAGCELAPSGQQAGCRATAAGNYGRCMNSC